MGQTFFVTVPTVGGLIGAVIAGAHGYGTVETWAIAAFCAVIAFLAWWISPLPWHNGGVGLPEPRLERWGFTSALQEDDA